LETPTGPTRSPLTDHQAETVKEDVNFESMPEYGLDCQSRRRKSCVVNDGSLSTEVLRVAIGYRDHFSRIFQHRDHSRAELCFKLSISTGYEPVHRPESVRPAKLNTSSAVALAAGIDRN
jgi:hypothetical protein